MYSYSYDHNDEGLILHKESHKIIPNESYDYSKIRSLQDRTFVHYSERNIKDWTLFHLTARFPSDITDKERNEHLLALYNYIDLHVSKESLYSKMLLIFNINFLLIKPSTQTVQFFYGTSHDSRGLKDLDYDEASKIVNYESEEQIDKTMFYINSREDIVQLPSMPTLVANALDAKTLCNFDESGVQIGPVMHVLFTFCMKYPGYSDAKGVLKQNRLGAYYEDKRIKPNRKRKV